jgi:toxin ParE1/3/4
MPQAYRVIVSPRAFADLDAILDYISQDSPANAVKMIDRLWDSAKSLEQLPHRYRIVFGRRRPAKETRMMPVPPYLIYYRIVEEQSVVRVITIRHAARRRLRRLD